MNSHGFELQDTGKELTRSRVFTVFGIMTNILVTAMLLTGGAAVISSLTGMASS